MPSNYFEIQIPVKGELAEILIAELSDLSFDSFVEEESVLKGYVPEDQYNEQELIEILRVYNVENKYQVIKVETKNWNEEWEKNYDPVEVIVGDEKRVKVRASFHDSDSSFKYDILINPKMSFGTGHHATTSNMLKLMTMMPLKDKSTVDLGTGTGVLAIMAHKLGAKSIRACDIDTWCVENGNENFQLNGIDTVQVELGTAGLYENDNFDVVLANINRNVLLSEMGIYANICQEHLVLSGFYEHDLEIVNESATAQGFTFLKKEVRNDWVAALYKRTN